MTKISFVRLVTTDIRWCPAIIVTVNPSTFVLTIIPMNRNNTRLLTLLALALIAATESPVHASEFDELLKHPKTFNGRRVTLVGLAEIGGSEFFLYPDVQSAKRGENAIFVDAHILNENSYQKFNNHW